MAAPYQSDNDYHGFAKQSAAVVSVTSNDASAISAQAASAINVVSNALSNLQSIHDVLSNRVSANSGVGGGGGSVTSNQFSDLVSAVDVVSNALSNLASVVGGIAGGSVTSDDVSAVSAQAASAIDVVSNALSVEIADRVSTLNVVSNAASDALSVGNAASAAASNAASIANAVSLRIANVSARTLGFASVKGVQTAIDTLSAKIVDTISNELSGRNALSMQVSNLISAHNATSNLLSTISARNSVGTSSKGPQTAINTLSNRISELSNAISTVSATLTPLYYNPTSAEVGVGTLASGSVGDLSAIGGGQYHVCEILSTPGFTITLIFSAVCAVPNMLLIRGAYEGGAGHHVNVDIYDQAASAWDTLGVVPDNASANTYQYMIIGGSDYLSGTYSKIRLNHLSAGINTHDIHLDYVALARLIPGAGITDHGLLQGLSDDDHTQYALADGSRGFTAVSNAASNAASIANAVSVVIANVSAKDEAGASVKGLQSAIAKVDQRINYTSYKLSGLQEDVTSLEGTVSNIVLGESMQSLALLSVNQALSNLTARNSAGVPVIGLQSVVDTLSNRISELSTGISNALSVGADGRSIANAASAAAAALSTALASVSARNAAGTSVRGLQSAINMLSNRISANSGVGGGASVTSNELSAVEVRTSTISAAVFSASARNSAGTSAKGLQTVINTLSNRISEVSNTISALEVRTSTISAAVFSVSARNSAGTSAKGLQTAVNTLSNRISEISQQHSVLSQAVSVLSQAQSVLSAAVAAAGVPLTKYLTSNAAAITTNVLSDIAGLAITVAASTIYEFKAVLMYSTSINSPNIGFGLSFPTLLGGGGKVEVAMAQIQETTQSTIDNRRIGYWTISCTNSIIVSVTRGGTAGPLPALFRGVMFVGGAAGTVACKAKTSSGQSLVIEAGSFVQIAQVGKAY